MLDVEAWLCAHLGRAVGVPAYTDVPTGAIPSPAFLVVRRVGGVTMTRVSDEPMVTVEAYGRSRDQSWSLMRETRDVVLALARQHDDVLIYRVREVAGPAHLPNPSAPLHTRYTMTAQLRTRQ